MFQQWGLTEEDLKGWVGFVYIHSQDKDFSTNVNRNQLMMNSTPYNLGLKKKKNWVGGVWGMSSYKVQPNPLIRRILP